LPLEPSLAARLSRGESLDLALEIAGAGRVRAHVYTTFSGPVAALRLLPRAAPTFASLNMPCSFDDLVDLPHGLVLVCGAAGSGKSTTLAALAQEALRRRSIVLITLEDPIEYSLVASATSLVRRRQIGRDARDFASGLRDALRADPDVLLIGEIRDRESISLALTAAETGHLVLASVHSRSAASAIERVIDGFAADQQLQVRQQLAESLRAVVAQRLVRRKHGDGRVPALELLRVNRAVASLIRDSKSAQLATVLQSARREGMLALERCLADRVLAGEVDVEDAVAAANDTEALAQFLKH
jgi:twitching motility protein PilT